MRRRRKLSQKHNDDLEKLKSLLLAEELEQLEALVARIGSLEPEIKDPEKLKERLLPLFDDLLLENLQTKDASTRDILARYLSDILSRSARIDREALQKAIAPILSPAIAKEIEDNKDRMIDALYPIMGGMISKYVAHAIKEMMESINRKIEQGFSFDRYLRKLKAKVSGVSESELLLQVCDDATIEALFVIHKETGLLIAEALREDSTIDDPELVASMASAVKDFINDWINAQEEEAQKEVQLLSYGDATLYIESAGSVYMIAFLASEPSYEQRGAIRRFFADVVEAFGDYFQRFDGEGESEEVARIETQLRAFMKRSETTCTKRSTPYATYIFGLLGLLALSIVLYQGYRAYRYHMFETEVAKRYHEDVRLSEAEEGGLRVEGAMHRFDDISKIVAFLQRRSGEKVRNDLALAPEAVTAMIAAAKTPAYDDGKIRMALQRLQQKRKIEADKIAALEDALRQSRQETRSVEKRLRLFMKIAHIGETLDRALADSPFYDAKRRMLVFDGKEVFAVGEVAPEASMRERIAEDLVRYLEPYMKNKEIAPYVKKIEIVGYTDDRGNHAENLEISDARARSIAEIVSHLEAFDGAKIASLIETKGLAEKNLIFKNGKVDSTASRRVEVSVSLDEDKINERLKNGDE